MLIVGLKGSPRKKSNTGFLLRTFMDEYEKLGAKTTIVHVSQKNILSCRGCGTCEKTGFCAISKDDMALEIFPLLRQADMIIAATPIYFYHFTAQLKALIDRCQTLWSRKYRLHLRDPKADYRVGFLLSAGATKGKNLFEGLHLTMKVFCDAVGAHYEGGLTYRRVEKQGDIQKNPDVPGDIQKTVQTLVKPMLQKPRILFLCKGNTCRSQMAAAFARHIGGQKVEALSAGTHPEKKINPAMMDAMQTIGIDMAFHSPKSITAALEHGTPDLIITMGQDVEPPDMAGIEPVYWNLPDPFGQPMETMQKVRDEIETRVKDFILKI